MYFRSSAEFFRRSLLIVCLWVFCGLTPVTAQLSVLSWNLKDFGHSKTDKEIDFIATIISRHDLVAIQEVVAGPGGAQAVARLMAALNRTGNKWDYDISSVTSGSSAYKAERYAFIWKTSKVKKIEKGWLEKHYSNEIEREPFFCRFQASGKTFTLVNFHAITKSKQPEREVKYFKFFPALYPSDKLLFCGDFNLPQSHSVFYPLKRMGYQPALVGQKTSLRQKCLQADCLASEFDNFFFNPINLVVKNPGVIHFYQHFDDLKSARKLTDHIPIYVTLYP